MAPPLASKGPSVRKPNRSLMFLLAPRRAARDGRRGVYFMAGWRCCRGREEVSCVQRVVLRVPGRSIWAVRSPLNARTRGAAGVRSD